MKTQRIIHSILLVLVLAALGLLFYYAIWILTDGSFRQEVQQGWPFSTWETLVDYAASCLFTTVVTLY